MATTHTTSYSLSLQSAEKRLLTIGLSLLALALLGSVFDGAITLGVQQLLQLRLNAHGHTHLYAHGHPFVDARSFWGIPNALDVLSNLPFAVGGLWGLCWLRVSQQATALPRQARAAATVFFAGLVLTCLGSSYYHWAPTAWGLAIDRAGMAVAFAGVLGLVAVDKVSLRAAPVVWVSMLLAAALAIGINYAAGWVLPWVVVQFGGMAVVLWASRQHSISTGLTVRWGVLIGLYALAKLLELGDEAVFHAAQGWVSGHTLKHVVASFAALPVILAILSPRTKRPLASYGRHVPTCLPNSAERDIMR